MQTATKIIDASYLREGERCELSVFPTEAVSQASSSCWRKNTSSLEAVELSNLLRAVRKVAGHLGENVGQIEFAGMSSITDNMILIDPDTVMGQYPVPADKVDSLIGLVVHEAMHRIEWSDHVWTYLEPAMQEMSPLAKVIFQKLVSIGESIFLDLRSEQTVFGLYTRIPRCKAIRSDLERFSVDCLSVDMLMTIWWQSAFVSLLKSDIRPEHQAQLEVLTKLTLALKAISKITLGVTRRCKQRADLYLHTWNQIEPTVVSLNMIEKHLRWCSDLEKPIDKPKLSKGLAPVKGKVLPPDLARDIEGLMYADSVDMTPLIRSVAGYENETVAPISRWDFQTESHPFIDQRMVGRLRSIFSHYAGRDTVKSRGLTSGKIDRRRLFRAGIDQSCFYSVDRIPDLNWSVGLLVDASGSMRGNKWQIVENTIATIHKALSGYRNNLKAWAYFEASDICMISRLISGNRLYSLPPAGQTASGQALIAAASMLPENLKRTLLIHVTDGESNFGCDVSYGIDYCRQRNIQLITLGCGCNDRSAMVRQYGSGIQFIDFFEQLPTAVESLFKWAFLCGGKQLPKNYGTITEKQVLV